MTEEVRLSSFKNLLEQFESTKRELGDAEANIRKLTGRDPEKFPNENNLRGSIGLNKRRPLPLPVPDKPFLGNKRPLFPIVKVKEEGEAKQAESPDEDEAPTKKPSLSSTVVASKDLKSRKDTIQEQNINSKVKARNRRMLGMILGTLQKFQHDAKKTQETDLKRAQIEKKVEAAAAEEKEKVKKEREELFQLRREKQAQLRCLEKKLEIAELHEIWENNEKHLFNFIRTKCEPSICYLPASHNSKTAKCLELSQKLTLERIKERREKTEKELMEVEEMYKKSNFPSDKENIGPTEEERLAELSETLNDQNDQQISPDTQLETNRSFGEESKIETEMDSEEGPALQNSSRENNSQEMLDNHETNSTEMETKSNNHQDSQRNSEDNVTEQSNQDFEPIYD